MNMDNTSRGVQVVAANVFLLPGAIKQATGSVVNLHSGIDWPVNTLSKFTIQLARGCTAKHTQLCENLTNIAAGA